jgi:hypothetical protein
MDVVEKALEEDQDMIVFSLFVARSLVQKLGT